MRYFLKLKYDGTSFHGWQRQPNAVSVQEVIEEALATVLRNPTPITGAGRTDAGVHARQMFAHIDSVSPIVKEKILPGLNKLVGPDIALLDLIPVKDSAHARFDAIARSYTYYIHLEKDPFARRFSHFMHRLPDVQLMNCAAQRLLGTQDFTSFSKLHTDTVTNICTVTYARWDLFPDENKLTFTITADRFLRNMVRSVVGTLIDVGTGKLNLDGLLDVIQKKDRCAAGTSMPANGLFLENIVYPQEIFIL